MRDLEIRGQKYKFLRREKTVRKNGMPGSFSMFETHCPDCGDLFEVRVKVKTKYPTRRCPKHRRQEMVREICPITTGALKPKEELRK